jgi:hypothetical protein
MLCKVEELDDFLLSLVELGKANFSSAETILHDLSGFQKYVPYPNQLNEKLFLKALERFF